MKKMYQGDQCVICNSQDKTNKVFVFGSNLGGIHGKGAAEHAYAKHNAKLHTSQGFTSRSLEAYAIPTKDANLRALSLARIEEYILIFLGVAASMPDYQFILTKIGCGFAGYENWQIAPYFRGATDNIVIPVDWIEILEQKEIE
jgi:hypothetical protein